MPRACEFSVRAEATELMEQDLSFSEAAYQLFVSYRKTQRWAKGLRERIICISLLAYLTDINLIENVWDGLKYQLLYLVEPRTSQETWAKIIELWNSKASDPNYCQSFYDSINVRLTMIIHKNRYPIQYFKE